MPNMQIVGNIALSYSKLTPQQVAKSDYVISLSEFHAEVVRAP